MVTIVSGTTDKFIIDGFDLMGTEGSLRVSLFVWVSYFTVGTRMDDEFVFLVREADDEIEDMVFDTDDDGGNGGG